MWDGCDNGDLEEVKRLVEEEDEEEEFMKIMNKNTMARAKPSIKLPCISHWNTS